MYVIVVDVCSQYWYVSGYISSFSSSIWVVPVQTSISKENFLNFEFGLF